MPATCKNVLVQDVPLPKKKLPKTRTELEPIAADAAKAQAGQLQSKLHMEDLAVACRYVGVSGRLAADDVEANSAPDDNVEFEWALQSGDWDWKEVVRIRRRDVLTRGLWSRQPNLRRSSRKTTVPWSRARALSKAVARE